MRSFASRAANATFSNPWAECWGSKPAPAPEQMRAEFGGVRQMESSSVDEPCNESAMPAADGSIVRVLPIVNNKGLHARASAKFVQTSERFNAEVKVSRCGETVGGLSIMGLMMLAAARGTTITVEVRGQEAAACMAAIEALVADKFGEEA